MTARRRRVASLTLPALAVLLAACQPLPHPFADDRPPAALLAVPDSFDIAVDQLTGEPRAVADKLPAAIAHELLQRNIAASDETTSKNSYHLDGRIETRPDQPGKSLVTVYWRLSDPKGNVVSERSDKLAAPTKDWTTSESDGPISQLAAAGATGFAALLADETPKEQQGGGRTRVAVRKVAGAPGDGDNSLASSLTAVLKHRDIELVDASQGKPDLDVDADIKVDPSTDGKKQHVKIVWHVARAAGGEIGQVAQENDVPRGRLDGAWGDIAYSVAMAAEGGIMQLVDHAAPRPKGGMEAAASATPAAVAPIGLPSGDGAADTAAPAASTAAPVAGNLDSPEVNLPPVSVSPSAPVMPAPLEPAQVPVLLPYRGVPIPQ